MMRYVTMSRDAKTPPTSPLGAHSWTGARVPRGAGAGRWRGVARATGARAGRTRARRRLARLGRKALRHAAIAVAPAGLAERIRQPPGVSSRGDGRQQLGHSDGFNDG